MSIITAIDAYLAEGIVRRFAPDGTEHPHYDFAEALRHLLRDYTDHRLSLASHDGESYLIVDLPAGDIAHVPVVGGDSIAAQISHLFDDDGQHFTADNGIELSKICADFAGVQGTTRDSEHGERYVFPDDSVITIAGAGWDLGYPDCWCWQGTGHIECGAAAHA